MHGVGAGAKRCNSRRNVTMPMLALVAA